MDDTRTTSNTTGSSSTSSTSSSNHDLPDKSILADYHRPEFDTTSSSHVLPKKNILSDVVETKKAELKARPFSKKRSKIRNAAHQPGCFPFQDEEEGCGGSVAMLSTIMAPYVGRTKRRVTINAGNNHENGIEAVMARRDWDEQSAMTVDSPYGQDALIAGMERTFFAALNSAWLMVFAGVGLMSVGHNDDRAVQAGTFVFVAGLLTALLACVMHVWRIAQIKLGIAFPLGHSALWAVVVSGLAFTALCLELYFALTYPYLKRSQSVVLDTTQTIAPNYLKHNLP